jgi:hypothetical protein
VICVGVSAGLYPLCSFTGFLLSPTSSSVAIAYSNIPFHLSTALPCTPIPNSQQATRPQLARNHPSHHRDLTAQPLHGLHPSHKSHSARRPSHPNGYTYLPTLRFDVNPRAAASESNVEMRLCDNPHCTASLRIASDEERASEEASKEASTYNLLIRSLAHCLVYSP